MCWICFRLSINKLQDTPEERHSMHSSSAESECVPAQSGLRICEIKTESQIK